MKNVTLILFLILCKCFKNLKIDNYISKGTSSQEEPNSKKLKDDKYKEKEDKVKLSRLLIKSSEEGNVENVKAALSQGADIEYKDHNGITALGHAVNNNYKSVVKILIKKGANPKNIHLPSFINVLKDPNNKILKVLIKNGFDVNARDKDGNTILISVLYLLLKGACYIFNVNNDFDMTKILLKNNANPNARNIKGDSPLILAVRGGRYQSLKSLLSMGADPNIQDKNGDTPLMNIVKNNNAVWLNYKMTKVLIKAGGILI